MRVYWECNNEYVFKKDKNYLIYFRGGFTPCHKGHFSVIKKFAHLDNVKFMIHQIGNKSRHGVPYKLNKEIWEIYIKYLLPRDKISLVKFKSKDQILTNEFINDIDVVIYVRGNEDYNQIKTEKSMKEKYKHLHKQLKKQNKNLDFYYLDRPLKNTLSATKFVEKLIKNQNKKCDCKYKFKSFFPEGLPSNERIEILKKLYKCKLKV